MKKFYFLSGLPRSGSTLLSALLNQHPKVFSSKTSDLVKEISKEFNYWYKFNDKNEIDFYGHIKKVISKKYEDINKPIVIDKSRGWTKPNIVEILPKIVDNPIKIITTVRSVPDCVSSYVRIVKPKDVNVFLNESPLIKNLEKTYFYLHRTYLSHPDKFLFIDYDDLMTDPKKEMTKISKFLNIYDFDYDFNNIDGTIVEEMDEEIYGIPNLHTIKPKLERQHNDDSKIILGSFYDKFNEEKFWDFK